MTDYLKQVAMMSDFIRVTPEEDFRQIVRRVYATGQADAAGLQELREERERLKLDPGSAAERTMSARRRGCSWVSSRQIVATPTVCSSRPPA